jgi:UDP-2,3-diacylglucosamine pyrophosphatase LpxH
MADGHDPHADATRRVRALFISDVHFGTRDCQAASLLELLQQSRADRIYLIGDIVDGWRLKASWYWPPSHDAVVRTVLQLMQNGTRVLYIPGNHDEFLRASLGLSFGGIEIVDHAIHRGADGRSHLVIHGDAFDPVVAQMRRLAALGIWVYAAAVLANDAANRWRRRLRQRSAAPHRAHAFERLAVAEARRRRLDGVICGHVHCPALHEVDGIQYLNAGDWVESCTAAVEHLDGSFALVGAAKPVGDPAFAPAGAQAEPLAPAWHA